MRPRILALFVMLLVFAGCDRGSHPALVGRSAPDFTVQDPQRTVVLSQLRGKIVILNFWATWCGPCVEEVPSLVAMQKQLAGRVTVLAVSLDEDDAAYQKFLRDYHVDLLTVRDPDKRSSLLYGTTGYPESYVIDRNGRLLRKFIGPVHWTSPEILEYLNKL